MVFLIAVSICYLAHIFERSVLTPIRMVVIVGGGINQIYTCSWDNSGYIIRLLIVTIALGSLKVSIGDLDA